MLSRVADSIYWLNRYVERAENIARFVDVNLNLLLDAPVVMTQQWEPLIMTTGDLPLFRERYGKATADNVIQFLTFDQNYSNSILSCLRAARENARSVREIISSEMWEQVNTFYLMVLDASQVQPLPALPSFFAEVKMASHLFAGVMDATMAHNEGWHFGRLGRLIERADKTARILDVKYFILLPEVNYVGTALDELQWIALLKSASGYEMYRKRQRRISPTDIAKFLILDREFPRSIQFCLLEAEQSLHQITGCSPGTWNNAADRTLGRLRAELDFITIEEIIQTGLHEFLDHIQIQLNYLGRNIFETFFSLEKIHS
ncbi:MAG: alpha-E domain-containing protein [Leptolyngbya sp. IPPAS B-1204]|uniref:Alpha-E domain-containing protein n=1 Tax=Leptolyngbya sp. NK1-12 TaxID=2547451 RepID=A0AA96WC87_9CYAN|nr:alpha-E domain-containing protein [Leptolyngbya sp. NK1-12]MBF2050670.1 alpha-E domain-containing protein [Elainella sp. C42_A2020_010]RNJ70517.1 MAG: alpha-E domain-containing protein [Leptolyngbya sp. IPPAS B-1204]WNZ22423.1 alpha-E domain-containing protein [Leptolyngbya sp. NK1-12]